MRTAVGTDDEGPGRRFRPQQFADLKEIADAFVADNAVVVEVPDDVDLARRLIDFLSGLVYASGGSLERVAQGLYRADRG